MRTMNKPGSQFEAATPAISKFRPCEFTKGLRLPTRRFDIQKFGSVTDHIANRLPDASKNTHINSVRHTFGVNHLENVEL